MKINIITQSESCVELVKNVLPLDSHTIELNYIKPEMVGFIPDFINNDFGWTSWLTLRDFSYLKNINFRKLTSSDLCLKTNVYNLDKFIKQNRYLSFEKLQTLFFHKLNNKYVTEKYLDELKSFKKLKIDETSLGLSLDFLYKEDDKKELVADDKNINDAYEQFKNFYYSFSKKNPSSLFILPHFDPRAIDEREILEGRDCPETYSSSQNEDCPSDWWEEMGREEEKRMDKETNGDWRWNID